MRQATHEAVLLNEELADHEAHVETHELVIADQEYGAVSPREDMLEALVDSSVGVLAEEDGADQRLEAAVLSIKRPVEVLPGWELQRPRLLGGAA